MEFTFELLEKFSLFVKELHGGPFKGGFSISNYPFITDLADLRDLPETKEDQETCQIFSYENDWYFYRWKYVPGPGEDDVHLKLITSNRE